MRQSSDMKIHQTNRALTTGTILLREGVVLPPEMKMESIKHSAGWQTLPGANCYALDRQLRLLGWSCTFLSREIKTISFGFSRAAMLKSALRRLLAKVRILDFNCAEVTTITPSRFLGIPYLRVRGHARHIQPSFELDGKVQRRKQQKAIDWARG